MPRSAPHLTEALLDRDRRVLLLGAPGVGKSTLAAELAQTLSQAGRACLCIGADPGSPAFGVPGALGLARWRDAGWQTLDLEALCSLDAGRFRLPLLQALEGLLVRLPPGALLIDGPGVVRGVAGAELLSAMIHVAAVDAVLCVARRPEVSPLSQELAAGGVDVVVVAAAPEAHRPGKRARARARTRLWDAHLQGAGQTRIALDGICVLGTPPPADAGELWAGRQLALLDARQCTLALGEVLALEGGDLVVRMPPLRNTAVAALVRDARRTPDGLLNTEAPRMPGTHWYTPPPDMLAQAERLAPLGPRPVLRVGEATVTLVNGVFGDPLLHLRLQHRRRSLLFDLGEARRLPARIAHQVSEVWISHAHFDHIAGFLWLLRSRIGVAETCRVFGPPGLADNIQGLVNGIHWDRIGERGPRFDVCELHGERLVCYRVQAGHGAARPLKERSAPGGVLLDEPRFRVRAATLDHGTPVLAFAFEPPRSFHIRKERLVALGLAVGPWLGTLKEALARDEREAPIRLPTGDYAPAGRLGDELVLVRPGPKLVYATDLADTRCNRDRLTALARGAHTLFCEAVFLERDRARARNTGHLTATACGEIATAAGVERLVPFHLSRRYQDSPQEVYDEVRAACPRTLAPVWRDVD
jgi:ribonuclease BN (tRNA processing enzyme)